MHIGILIFENSLKSSIYGVEELFYINNSHCKSSNEKEIKTTFLSFEKNKIFDTKIASKNDIFDVVIIPPVLVENETLVFEDNVVKWLILQHKKGAILASACAGTFLLAQTKLLDGKAATTHWVYEELFKKSFPNVYLQLNKILLDEKDIITAGGINAYLDLCLYIIEKLHSHRTATQLANLMLIDRGRVSQKSYKSFSTVFLYDDQEVKEVVQWMKDNIKEQISICNLANRVNTSERTFTRRFKKALNITPNHFLQNIRIEKAKELLITTNKSFDDVTFEVGFFDESSFRKLFKRETSLNPKEYRKKFKQVIEIGNT